MSEDWNLGPPAPGLATPAVTSRGWLEHRSRIQGFQSVVRYAWILGGIHDALREGNVELARARTALGLAFADQTSCDRGSFLLSQEVTLEPAPPFSAFAAHSLPEAWESQHSRLIDQRCLDLFIHKIKELSEYHERKGKLATRRRVTEDEEEKAAKAKAKAKSKGAGKGKEREEA